MPPPPPPWWPRGVLAVVLGNLTWLVSLYLLARFVGPRDPGYGDIAVAQGLATAIAMVAGWASAPAALARRAALTVGLTWLVLQVPFVFMKVFGSKGGAPDVSYLLAPFAVFVIVLAARLTWLRPRGSPPAGPATMS